jgi:hypothetical protein
VAAPAAAVVRQRSLVCKKVVRTGKPASENAAAELRVIDYDTQAGDFLEEIEF